MTTLVVGPGGTHSTVASAVAEMPPDIIASNDNFIVEVKLSGVGDGFFNENRIVLPTPTNADANHRPILRAYAGDEVDGFGNGAGLLSARGYREILALADWWIIDGLRVTNHDALGYGIDLGNATNTIIRNCWVSGGAGALYLANASTPTSTVENMILSGQSNTGTPQSWRTLNLNGIDGTVNFDRLTVIDSNTDGIEGSAFSTGSANFTNCFAIGSVGSDFDNRVATESTSDYLASGDTTATNEAVNDFPGRTTTDLADYAGGNFNLASGSTLKGAGTGGSDIGATLPATPSGPTYTLTIDPGASSTNGADVAILAHRRLSIDAGQSSATGQNANLLAHRKLTFDPGVVSGQGADINMVRHLRLAMAPGTSSTSGYNITFIHNQGPQGATYTLAITPGISTTTGSDATLRPNRKLAMVAGNSTATGSDVAMRVSRKLTIAAGTSATQVNNAYAYVHRKMTLEAGTAATQGYSILFNYSGFTEVLVGAYTIQFAPNDARITFTTDDLVGINFT